MANNGFLFSICGSKALGGLIFLFVLPTCIAQVVFYTNKPIHGKMEKNVVLLSQRAMVYCSYGVNKLPSRGKEVKLSKKI